MEDILEYPAESEWDSSARQATSSHLNLSSSTRAQEAHLRLFPQLPTLGDIRQHQMGMAEALDDAEEEMLEVDSEAEVECRRVGTRVDIQAELLDSEDEMQASSARILDSVSLNHFQCSDPVSSPPADRRYLLGRPRTPQSPPRTPMYLSNTSLTKVPRTPSPVLIFDSEDNTNFAASPTNRLSRLSQNTLQAQNLVLPSRIRSSGLRRNSASSDSSFLLRTPSPPPLNESLSLFDRKALCSTENLIGVSQATRSRASSPTQAEMDAFFGYIDPLKANHPPPVSPNDKAPPRFPLREVIIEPERLPLPLPPLPSAALPLSPPRAPTPSIPEGYSYRPLTSPDQISVKHRRPPASMDVIALKPIVNSQAMSSSGRRLTIISSLQRVSLEILQNIVKNIQTLTSPSNSTALAIDPDGSAAAGAGNITDLNQQGLTFPRPEVSLSIELIRRGGRPNRESNPSQGSTTVDQSSKKQRIMFPRKLGKGKQVRLGGRELACFLRVVELALDGLVANVVSTKRDLYYRDVSLFRKQQTVDSLVEDLAATLGVRRSDLNIVATSKGIFSGHLALLMKDGTKKTGSVEGTLIPPAFLIDRLEVDELSWVLVVEKDAVFQSLSPVEWDLSLGNGVLVTAKGYPDVSTRELVKKLADDSPSVPIMFLVDADPHGIEILSTFVLGSSALSHDSSNLAIGYERANWIGIKPTSLVDDLARRDESLLLNSRDRRKAIAMMRREWFPAQWRRELECLLHLNRKAEIEILSSTTPTPMDTPANSLGAANPLSSFPSRLVEFVATEMRKVLSKTKVE
ncbi:hypothetical protein JCM3765_002953 [Sporobolomyces pararoseus]